jgi:hypothetical protein
MKPLKSYQEATQCLSDYVLLDPKCPPYRSWGRQIPRSEILLLKRGLNFGKNAKIFLKGEVFGFWALFKNYSPGLETFETHFDSFELLYCIYKSPSPQAKVLVPQSSFNQVPQSLFKEALREFLAHQVPQSLFKEALKRISRSLGPPVLGQKNLFSNAEICEIEPESGRVTPIVDLFT